MPTPQQRKAGDKPVDDQAERGSQTRPDPTAGQTVDVQMATETPPFGGTDAGGLASLEARVTRLENMTGNRLNTAAGRTQDEIDDEILARQPNSHPEAVAYEAAKERRDKRRPDADETSTPDAGETSTPDTGGSRSDQGKGR